MSWLCHFGVHDWERIPGSPEGFWEVSVFLQIYTPLDRVCLSCAKEDLAATEQLRERDDASARAFARRRDRRARAETLTNLRKKAK